MTMSRVIRLDEVTKCFGSEVALNKVSLEIPPGVVFALLGENGAGKTTAIRILLGLLQADTGLAEVLNRLSASQGEEIRRLVGYVPEQPTLYDWMSVFEIGWFTAGFYGGMFLENFLEQIMRFGLDEHQKVKALSKGMRAKVALSLALAHEPELLILDEPTSGLDALVRREFLESMVDLTATGKTVFLSSHQIHEVERVADYVAMIREGDIVLVSRLDVLKEQVREVTLTLSDDGSMPTHETIPAEVIQVQNGQRQCQWVVRNLSEQGLAALKEHASVRQVDVRELSLEEIFVAYMQRRDAPADRSDSEEASLS